MADRVYNLTQTGAEVQDIINDADNAKGAGATTSLTTDYIMLKDTNGQYHKIQKDSFTEAVRNTLASLLVNNDKGTTISQIAAIASGDFGSVTPANLASVLGANYSNGTAGASLDAYYQKSHVGWYLVNPTVTTTGKPVSEDWGFLLVSGTSDAMTQTFYNISGTNRAVYVRVYHNGNWDNWKTNYDSSILTNSELLSPLASALGAVFETSQIQGKTWTTISSSKYGIYYVFENNTMGISSLIMVTNGSIQTIKANPESNNIMSFRFSGGNDLQIYTDTDSTLNIKVSVLFKV